MEYRIKDYTIKGQQIVLTKKTGIEDVRLIYNETQKVLICSTAKKDNLNKIDSFTHNPFTGEYCINVPTDICVLNATDKLTIKCDYGDDLTSVENKVEEEADSIEAKINESVNTLSTKIDNIKLPEIDTTEFAKQGENQEATNSKILEEVAKESTLSNIAEKLNHMSMSSRTIDGVYGVSDGISIVNLLGSQADCLAVTEIKDKNTGWVCNKADCLSILFSNFPNITRVELGMSDSSVKLLAPTNTFSSNAEIIFTNFTTNRNMEFIGNSNAPDVTSNVSVHVYGYKVGTNKNQAAYFRVGKVFFHDIEYGYVSAGYNASSINRTTKYLYLGCKGVRTNVITVSALSSAPNTSIEDIEIRQGACQNISILYVDGLKEENMVSHILKKLKQDEEMCGSGVTITLGATNLAKLTSEEAVALLDSLTNTYGYTFA